jgi:hypothetical protein
MPRKGRWKPGESGNPRGRKPGFTLLQTRLRKELEEAAPAAIKRLLELAARGNIIALRLVVEKVLPTPRSAPVSIPVEIDGMPPAEQAARALSAMAAGQLTVEESGELIRAISATQNIKIQDEVMRRLAEIETKLASLVGASLPVPTPALPPPGADDASS